MFIISVNITIILSIESMNYKKSKIVPILGYLYLTIPPLIFCFGWLKWCFATMVGIVFLICTVFIYRKINPIDVVIPRNRKEIIIISLVLAIIVLIIVLSGIANNSSQTWDMYWRNTIFTELVNEKWPCSMTGIVGDKETTIYLVYYIGFYLLPALMGKMFGLAFGFSFVAVWAIIGLLIIYFLIISHLKKIIVWPLVVLLCFSGFDYFNRLIFQSDVFDFFYHYKQYSSAYFYHLEWLYVKNAAFSIPSNLTQFYWTFNQAIPLFVLLSLVFFGRQEHNIIFLTSCVIITSTLSCIGLALIILLLFFCKKTDDGVSYRFIHNFEEFKERIKQLVINPSVVIAVILTLFTGTYALSNSNVSGSSDNPLVSFQNVFADIETFCGFLIFVFSEVLIFCIYFFRFNKKNPLMYLSLFGAIFPSLILFNGSVDIMLKVTTPFMYIFFLMFICAFNKDLESKKILWLSFGITILAIGSFTGLWEIMRLSMDTLEMYKSNYLTGYAILIDVCILLVAFLLPIIMYAVKNIGYKYINKGLLVVAPVICVVSMCVLLSLIIGKGLDNPMYWNSSCDAWKELYLANNFSGTEDSLFFRIFAR